MATLRWAAPGTEQSVLDSTALASLGDGSNKLSLEFEHASGEMYGRFTLTIGATSSRTKSGVQLYILQDDGTTYQYGGDSLTPSSNAHKGSFLFDTGQTAGRVDIIDGVLLPPGSFKVLIQNNLGVAFGASGNSLTMSMYNTESA